MPRGGFGLVSSRVALWRRTFQDASPPDQARLTVKQDYKLQRVASHSILNILRRMEVPGSPELLRELEDNGAADPFSDMVKVELDHRNKAEGARMILEPPKRPGKEPKSQAKLPEAEKKRLRQEIVDEEWYARLAGAVGATARASVAAMTGTDAGAIWSSIDRAGEEVKAAADPELDEGRTGNSIGEVAGTALSVMLDGVEALAPPRPEPEPEQGQVSP